MEDSEIDEASVSSGAAACPGRLAVDNESESHASTRFNSASRQLANLKKGKLVTTRYNKYDNKNNNNNNNRNHDVKNYYGNNKNIKNNDNI